MTVIDLLRERALREVPRHLDTLVRDESFLTEFVFSSERVAHAMAWQMRHEIPSRQLPYSVARRGACVFLAKQASCNEVDNGRTPLLDGIFKGTHPPGETRRPPQAS